MRRTFLYGTLILSLLLFASFSYIVFKTFSKETFQAILSLKRKYLFLGLFLLFLYHTFDNVRLFILSRAVGIRYSFLYGYVMSLVNTFGATVTPAHLGGELASVYMLLRKRAGIQRVMSVVTMKAVSGGVFFLVALPFLLTNYGSTTLKVLILLALSSVLIYPLLRRSGSSLRRYWTYVKVFTYRRRRYLVFSLLASLSLYLTFLLFAPVLLLSFGKEVELGRVLGDQIALLYALFVSPTPGGSGVGEIGGLFVFESYLRPHELGLFVLIWRFLSQYLSALAGGLLFLLCLAKDLRR